MLNIIWPIFIIISYIFAIFTGNADKVNDAVFSYTETAVKLTITLFGTMCLWNGLMEIASNTRLINTINKILKILEPIILPISKSCSPLRDDTIVVINSGKLVPNAIIVRATTLSLSPNS